METEREKGEDERTKVYSVGNAKEVVNKYFGKENYEIDTLIRNWQYERAQDRLKRKYKRETNKIDEVMNCVPEIPKNFDKWAVDKGFWSYKYLFYDKANKKAYCTACNKEMQIDKKATFKHGDSGKCPICHRTIKYKAWNKQKTIRPEVILGLFQKLTDGRGYVLRKFRARARRERSSEWKLREAWSYEEIRITFDNNFNQTGFYEFGLYKPYGVDRWTTGINHGTWYYYYPKSVVLYPGNLNQVLKGSSLQYIPVKQLIEKNPGKSERFEDILKKLRNTPQYEYLIKLGLSRFAYSVIAENHRYEFNTGEKKLWRFLGITQEQLKYAIKHKCDYEFIRTCKRGCNAGVILTPEQTKFINKYSVDNALISKMRYTTPHKILRYIDEVLDVKNNPHASGDYYDYLRNCEKLDIPMDETTLFPQNFQRADQLCIEAVTELEDSKTRENADMQARAFRKSQEEKKKLYEFEDDKFILILPTTKKEFNTEGRNMHNCVAGYYDRVRKGDTTVLFLRRKENPEQSYCTVEIKGNELIQCRSIYNGDAPFEAREFMDKFLRELTKRLQSKKYMKKHEKVVQNVMDQLRSA